MWFRNIKSKVLWEVRNKSMITRLEKDTDYEEYEKKATKKKVVKREDNNIRKD